MSQLPPVQPPVSPFGEVPPPTPPPQKSNSVMIVLMGCLGVLLVSTLVCGGCVFYVARNAKRIGTDVVVGVLRQAIKDAALSEEDKRAINTQIDRLAEEFKAGRLTGEHFEKIVEELQESPLLPIGAVKFAEEMYLRPSDLPEEEKAAARLVFQRAARGAYERKIDSEDLQAVVEVIQEGPPENRRLKQRLTTEELRKLIADLKELADDAEIPEEPFDVDIGREVTRIVDDVLGPAKP